MTDNATSTHIEGYQLIRTPEYSDWQCDLFGMNGSYTLRPTVGNVPNWFWRLMQYLILGNRWYKIDKKRGGQ